MLGTFIWGMAFIAQSVGMETIGPFTFQAIRCMLGVIFLFLVTFFFDWKIGMRASLQKWKNKKLWISGIICGAALFAATSLQQVGLVYTAPGKAGFLTAMYIVLVPVLGIFVHRKPGINAVVSVLLALVGLYLLSFTDMGSINIGETAAAVRRSCCFFLCFVIAAASLAHVVPDFRVEQCVEQIHYQHDYHIQQGQNHRCAHHNGGIL